MGPRRFLRNNMLIKDLLIRFFWPRRFSCLKWALLTPCNNSKQTWSDGWGAGCHSNKGPWWSQGDGSPHELAIKLSIFYHCTRIIQSCEFFKVYQNLVTMSFFLSFLLCPFLPHINTCMDDYDGIYNCNGKKSSPLKNFDNFCFIIFYGDQNIRWFKRIAIRTRPFSSCVVHLKGFSPSRRKIAPRTTWPLDYSMKNSCVRRKVNPPKPSKQH
jgi:hypothetical protein